MRVGNDRNRALAGRTALITGGGHGIGRAISVRFAQVGARIVCADIDERAAQSVVAEITAAGGEAEAFLCDVTDPTTANGAVAFAVARFGGLYALVNNAAAFLPLRSVIDVADAEWDLLFRVNVGGVFQMSKAAIPRMRERGGGVVVNIASQLGHVALAGRGVYCATKAAVIQLTRAMALDHASENIRIVSLSPGSVASERLVGRYGSREEAERVLAVRHPIGRIADPHEIAEAALFLASDEASFMTGADLVVDGGYTAQ